jgi:AcrR family transcriptional regulator
MSRWEPHAKSRLEQATQDLYQERGFEQTMMTEIAEQAGLTKRSFFRYFADKREVLFGGQDILHSIYVRTIEAAPPSATPLESVTAAIEAAIPVYMDASRPQNRTESMTIPFLTSEHSLGMPITLSFDISRNS